MKYNIVLFYYYYYYLISLLSIIALQWCVSFCCITKWISYMYTYILISPPSSVSLPPSLSHSSRWSQSTKLISLCYAVTSHQLSILHLVVYICQRYSSSELFFFRVHIYVLAYGICFSLSDLLYSVWQTLGPSTSLQIAQFCFFLWLIFHCIYVPHLLYPFICRWTLRLLPCPGYCK